jgi:methionyl-tRNA formyltransferase
LSLRRRGLRTSAASRVSVLFFGTDDVSVLTLQRLDESMRGGGRLPGLVTQLDVVCPGSRPAGRGQHTTRVPVQLFAAAAGLRTFEVPYGL